MKIQVVNAYLKLQDEGRVPVIYCGNDRDHTRPFARLTDNDEVELYCLGCNWTNMPGLRIYESMKQVLSYEDTAWLEVDDG